MKRFHPLLAAVTSLSLSLFATSALAGTLTYGSPLPSTHVLNEHAIAPFLDHLTAASEGELKWRFYPGGTTAKLPAVMGSIRNGIVDAGYMIDSLTLAEQSYNVMVSRLGSFGEDPMVMAGVANELLLLECDQCRKQLTGQDIVPLAYVATTPFLMICRDRYDSKAELEGKRFRSPGSYGEIVSMWGGVPVNVPPTDIFEALQRGQADCTFGPEGHLTNYSLYEVAKYVTDFPFGMYISGSVFNMNKGTWESLPSEQRQLILQELPKLIAGGVRAYQEEAKAARKEAQAHGMTYLDAPDDVKDLVAAYRTQLMDSIDQAARKRGIDDIKPVLEKFPGLVEKWRRLIEQTGHDYSAFETLLEREIFSHYQP